MTFLSKVEHAFQIQGRGCVIIPAGPQLDFPVRIGDAIQLRNLNGQVVDTCIAGIEIACGPAIKCRAGFLLPGSVAKQDLPSGTEIWLANEQSQSSASVE